MFDLLTAHSRLGLTDASKDYYVNLGIATALAIAEKYCDRNFMQATETAKFYYVVGETLQLSRYPITAVTSISGSSGSTLNTNSYKVNLGAGQIIFNGIAVDQELDVTYSGGYTTLPLDLELALWSIFDAIWTATPGAGAAIGSVVSTTGKIKSVSVPDVGRIDYETSSSSSAAGTVGSLGVGFITDTAISLLEPYRRWSA
jgi:hypothetical protein